VVYQVLLLLVTIEDGRLYLKGTWFAENAIIAILAALWN
jgi:hypothetical protein